MWNIVKYIFILSDWRFEWYICQIYFLTELSIQTVHTEINHQMGILHQNVDAAA